MTGLMIMGAAVATAIAVTLALLVHAIGKNRISLAGGIEIVSLSCVLWHAIAALGLNCSVGFLHHLLLLSIIVPFGFGFGQGNAAFVVATLTQTVLTATIASGIYWWLRRRSREPATPPYSEPATRSPQG